MRAAPVHREPREAKSEIPKKFRKGVALCLSGGGYRAMLFHLGTLIRLNEMKMLPELRRVSSVSGGSVVAAYLGYKWKNLEFVDGTAVNFQEVIVEPIRNLAMKTMDLALKTVLKGITAVGMGAADEILHVFERIYDRFMQKEEDPYLVLSKLFPSVNSAAQVSQFLAQELFQNATLQDFPDQPGFYINATNLQTGNLWLFSKAYMGDSKIGFIKNPTVPIANAVAASSAFPPVLSPFILTLSGTETWSSPNIHIPEVGEEFTDELVDPSNQKDFDEIDEELAKNLQAPEFKKVIYLTDGGVYDNLGLETSWKRFKKILVSDGGARIQGHSSPPTDIIFQGVRITEVIDHQVRVLRKRQMIESLQPNGQGQSPRIGAFWSIRGSLKDNVSGLQPPHLPCPDDQITKLAHIPTRFRQLHPEMIDWLVNWGYAKCDAIMRSHAAALIPKGRIPSPEFPSKSKAVGFPKSRL